MLNNVYKVEDIFEDIEGDEENILMKIPEEIAAQMGWKPGDVLKVTWKEGIVSINKVENVKE